MRRKGPFKVGDLVQTWVWAGTHYSPTGRVDTQNIMFGRVRKVTPKTITILWESGDTKRVNSVAFHEIQRVAPDVVEAAMLAMMGVEA